jgi:hypothetical protein
MVEPGVEPVTTEYQVSDGGKALSVQEMWYPWRATKPGTLSVPPGVLQAQFAVARRRGRSVFDNDPFFSDLPGFTDVKTENVVSDGLSLPVRSLPTDGRPANFSGLVGHFEATATPSATQAHVGDTITVDVTIQGDGTLAGYKLPAWNADGWRVYDDEPVAESKLADGRLTASATFKRAVVPERPGDLELPPLDLNWFDPAAAAYVSADLSPITLHITGDAVSAQVEGFGTAVSKKGVEALGDDLLPVRTNVRLANAWPGAYGLALVAPGGALLAAEALRSFRRRARPSAQKAYGFDDLPEEPEARLAGLERIFRETCGRRLGRPAPELVEADVATLGEEAVEIYRELQRARYRGGRDLPEARVRAWVHG